jgi:hypothetical protein
MSRERRPSKGRTAGHSCCDGDKASEPVAFVILDLPVGKSAPNLVVALAYCAHHELTDAALQVHPPIWVLRCEALVVVFGPVPEQLAYAGWRP